MENKEFNELYKEAINSSFVLVKEICELKETETNPAMVASIAELIKVITECQYN
ncbi:hypothetical protein AB6889_02320 [Carnobacterium maltaromaticum]|uniref:hypothetical protein n=1 Tax=Carnobacterium maltaromaticum TaxID=2751 RepID=UPI0039BDFB01